MKRNFANIYPLSSKSLIVNPHGNKNLVHNIETSCTMDAGYKNTLGSSNIGSYNRHK